MNTPEELERFKAALPGCHHVEGRTVFGRRLYVAMAGEHRWQNLAGVFVTPETEAILAEAGITADCWE